MMAISITNTIPWDKPALSVSHSQYQLSKVTVLILPVTVRSAFSCNASYKISMRDHPSNILLPVRSAFRIKHNTAEPMRSASEV